MAHVAVEWARPHPLAPAATDGLGRIWMDPRLNQVERRCVLTHELVHLEHGHRGCQPRAVETAVRREAARRLVRMEHLTAALPWARDCDELADELWVTPMVLTDRYDGLTEAETAVLWGLELPGHQP